MSNGTMGTEELFQNKTGERFWVEVTSRPVQKNGSFAYYLSIWVDITERKKIEQMKSDFVSFISHQLRTPVAGIKAYIENMLAGLTGELSDKQSEYLQEMHDICSRNHRLLSDLLNVSRIERGIIAVNIKPVKLERAAKLAVRDYRRSIKEKGLALKLEAAADNIVVLADSDKLVEALGNIIDNAIKFTHEGSISIKLRKAGKYGLIEVRDTGEGIPSHALKDLFRKEKALSYTATPGSGAGLGLYIAKSFMELQGGDLTADSKAGKGSKFVLKLPLAQGS